MNYFNTKKFDHFLDVITETNQECNVHFYYYKHYLPRLGPVA